MPLRKHNIRHLSDVQDYAPSLHAVENVQGVAQVASEWILSPMILAQQSG